MFNTYIRAWETERKLNKKAVLKKDTTSLFLYGYTSICRTLMYTVAQFVDGK